MSSIQALTANQTPKLTITSNVPVNQASQTTTQQKAPIGDSGGLSNILADFAPATRQALADDTILTNLFDLEHGLDQPLNLNQKMLVIGYDFTTTGTDLTGTIGLVLVNNQADPISMACHTPNSTQPPFITDTSQPCAFVIGSMSHDSQWWATDNLEDGIELYNKLAVLRRQAVTVLVCINKWQFAGMVKHFAEVQTIYFNVTHDKKDALLNKLAGVNAKAVVSITTLNHLLDMHPDGGMNAVLALDDVEVIDLQATALPYANGMIEQQDDGVYFVTYTNDGEVKHKTFICSPLEIVAKCRDQHSQSWGKLLRWNDEAGITHTWAMPNELLQGDSREYRKILVNQGLRISTLSKAQQALDAYINNHATDNFMLCVNRLGWYQGSYVTPNTTFGRDDVVFQTAHPIEHGFSQQGTLEQWRNHLCKPMAEQSRIAFAISCAFAGQLLELVGMDGGGFHIVGASSMGKSIGLKVAGSVWGHPDGYIKRWRATDNGLENLAYIHNDGFFGLDEINEADPKVIGKASYMLANGGGKQRSKASGGNRTTLTWRTLFLSNGEQSLQSYMTQAGLLPKAGQEMRLCHIEADAGTGHKSFDSIVMGSSGEEQASIIQAHAKAYHGTAGMAWLEYLTCDTAKATATATQLKNEFMSRYPQCRGQAHRVAQRFAIVATAGEMASQAGITGWQTGQATNAVMRCFDNWLANYGSDGNQEQRQMLEHLKRYIELHGASRFQDWDNINKWTMEKQKISNRVGVISPDGSYYYFLPSVFADVCSPFDKKAMLIMLDEQGLLLKHEGRETARIRPPNKASDLPTRVYAVNADILNHDIKT